MRLLSKKYNAVRFSFFSTRENANTRQCARPASVAIKSPRLNISRGNRTSHYSLPVVHTQESLATLAPPLQQKPASLLRRYRSLSGEQLPKGNFEPNLHTVRARVSSFRPLAAPFRTRRARLLSPPPFTHAHTHLLHTVLEWPEQLFWGFLILLFRLLSSSLFYSPLLSFRRARSYRTPSSVPDHQLQGPAGSLTHCASGKSSFYPKVTF